MGRGALTEADLVISFGLIRQGRQLSVDAYTEKGRSALDVLRGAITS